MSSLHFLSFLCFNLHTLSVKVLKVFLRVERMAAEVVDHRSTGQPHFGHGIKQAGGGLEKHPNGPQISARDLPFKN